VGAAARFIGPEPERRAAVGGLRHLDVLTERWTGAPAKIAGLNNGVTITRKNLKRFIQTLDQSDQRALAHRAEEFIGAADALLNFEFSPRPVKLTPRQSQQLAKSRKELWLDVRYTLNALLDQIEDIGR